MNGYYETNGYGLSNDFSTILETGEDIVGQASDIGQRGSDALDILLNRGGGGGTAPISNAPPPQASPHPAAVPATVPAGETKEIAGMPWWVWAAGGGLLIWMMWGD